MKKYPWGKKLVANEIRPLIYKITENFRKYEHVENLERINEQIEIFNSMLNNEKILSLLERFSEEKYNKQQEIKELLKVRKERDQIESFKDFINSFDEEYELEKLKSHERYQLNIRNLKQNKHELIKKEPKLYSELDQLEHEYDKITNLDIRTQFEINLTQKYKEKQADFLSYYLIKKIENEEDSFIKNYLDNINERKYIDVSDVLSNSILKNNHNTLYSYVRIDDKKIKLFNLYFFFNEPNADIQAKLDDLKKENEKINKKINDIFERFRIIIKGEVQF